MKSLRTRLIAAVAVLTLPLAANAVTIVMDDTSGNNGTNVEGTMVFGVSGGAGAYTFAFSLENSGTLGGTRLTGVAFDLVAGAVRTSHTSAAGWNFQGDTGTLPGEAGAFDACFFSGPNCGGGGNGGLLETDPALSGFSVSFTLAGGLSAAEVESLFASGFAAGDLRACARIISIPVAPGSDVACYGGQDGDDDDQDVPEPGTLALLGLGLVGLGLGRRRRA